MKLSQNIIPYICAKLWAPHISTTTKLARFVGKSHDFLTRSMKHKYHWKKVFLKILQQYDLSDGYFIIDETESNKSYSKQIFGTSWIYSHLKNGFIFGLQIVFICWTNDKVTIPVAWKFYRKRDKNKPNKFHKTKLDLAMELVTYVQKYICNNHQGYLMDAFYSPEKLLKHISSFGSYYYTQITKTRLLDGKQVRFHEDGRPYWTRKGKLKGNIEVMVCKHRRKYFITNNADIETGKELRCIYRIRWNIEDEFRFCKSVFNFEGCEMRDRESHNNHFGVCYFISYLLQDSATKKEMTVYKVAEELSFDRSFKQFPNLATLLDYA